jgi:hypothetical protein
VISDTVRDDSAGRNKEASGGDDTNPLRPTGNDNADFATTTASDGMIPRISVTRDVYVPCGRLARPDAAWAHKACRAIPHSPPKSLAGSNVEHAVLTLERKLWGSGGLQRTTLNYFFLSGNEFQKQKVRAVITTWELYAFVHFQESHSAENTQIRITFDGSDGSWSYVRIQFLRNALP